jgi:hypothetical protein
MTKSAVGVEAKGSHAPSATVDLRRHDPKARRAAICGDRCSAPPAPADAPGRDLRKSKK